MSNQIVPSSIPQNIQSHIQKWELLDEQLKLVNEKTKKMRELKRAISTQICDYMDVHEPKIKLKNGELRIYEKKEYSPLSYSYIENCLEKIIKDREHIDYIIKYLKDNREIKITRDIKMF